MALGRFFAYKDPIKPFGTRLGAWYGMSLVYNFWCQLFIRVSAISKIGGVFGHSCSGSEAKVCPEKRIKQN